MNPTNLYTILGAACSSEEFANLLFTDPYAAARLLNLNLTDQELEALKTMVANGLKAGAQMTFAELRGKICPPNGVCPWVVVQGCGSGQAAD